MGAASLVLGIISIVIALVGSGFQWIGAILAIVGIILGVKGKKIPGQTGIAKGGLVCSIIGLILCSLMFILCVACVGGLASLGATGMGLAELEGLL